MSTLTVGLITFIIGTVFGYVANRFLSVSEHSEKKLIEQINQSESALSQYKQDVAEHLNQSADLLVQMNNTCQSAMQQMEQSTLLLKQATPAEPTTMPFFSAETQQQLAETANERHPKKQLSESAKTAQPPLDYSNSSSGLFVDKTQSVTNSET